MKEDKKTKEKLINVARKEFTEKGYNGASLRNICRTAGVTTGALYFFFKDKEDLFSSVVDKTVLELKEIIGSHFNLEKEEMDRLEKIATLDIKSINEHSDEYLEYFGVTKANKEEDVEAVNQIIHFMYSNKEIVTLLAINSKGTKYEFFIDELVGVLEEHYTYLAKAICKIRGMDNIPQFLIHWVSHEQIDIFVYLLTHIDNEKEASKLSLRIVNILYAGWFCLFGINQ